MLSQIEYLDTENSTWMSEYISSQFFIFHKFGICSLSRLMNSNILDVQTKGKMVLHRSCHSQSIRRFKHLCEVALSRSTPKMWNTNLIKPYNGIAVLWYREQSMHGDIPSTNCYLTIISYSKLCESVNLNLTTNPNQNQCNWQCSIVRLCVRCAIS